VDRAESIRSLEELDEEEWDEFNAKPWDLKETTPGPYDDYQRLVAWHDVSTPWLNPGPQNPHFILIRRAWLIYLYINFTLPWFFTSDVLMHHSLGMYGRHVNVLLVNFVHSQR
jgi:hypothetical protein